jgi:hypothetical protein
MSWLWKIDKGDEQPCRSAGVPLSDLHADVCSARDTRPAFCGQSCLIVCRTVSAQT